jgi:hypothetical protein
LQWLLLGGNQFSGPLPVQLGALPNLQQAQLQNNNFSGPVPSSWCSNMATYHVAFNPYLCGEHMITAECRLLQPAELAAACMTTCMC